MTPPSLRRAAPTLLVAAVFLLTVELLRATSPLLDRAAADLGVIGAAQLALAIFIAPAVVGVALALAGAGRTMIGAVAVLVALRLVAQAQDPATLPVVGAGAAVGIAALVLAVRQAPSGVVGAIGVLLGTVVDLAIRTAYGSWDIIFRPGVLPWVLLVVIAVGTLAATVAATGSQATQGQAAAAAAPAARLAGIGLYLALYLMLYGSAPIVAAHAGVSLTLASAVLIATAVVGIELVRRMRLPGGAGAIPEPDRWFAGALALAAATGAVVVAYWLTGPVVIAAAALAGLAAAVLLARALTSRDGAAPRRPAVRLAVAAGAAGLGYILPVMIYQVHYDLEFPFDNRWALVAAALLLGAAGLGVRPAHRDADRRGLLTRPAPVSVVAAVALLVPLAMVATRPAVPEPEQTGATIRLMNWNVMYGRDHIGGHVDPEAIAAAIEAVNPDVLVLQEVSRGWPIGGGMDMLEWLSWRLEMPYEWAPAADGQFGNAIMTRLPVSDVVAERFPFIQGPMERSYQAVTVELDSGDQVRIFNTHFQHRRENTDTRLVHSQVMLEEWDGRPHTIMAGDFNFWPSWPEAEVWAAAGFVSAQDEVGDPFEFTVPSHDPDNRVDYIFGTPDLTFSDFAVLSGVVNSDHFPLVVTVTVD
jgi:endonuclease/exonuclease/phosphatase family metal-dependent hydrolase